MAGRRAQALAAAIKTLRTEAKLSREMAIGYISVSDEFPSWMKTKCKRMILKAERKAEKEAGY